MIAVGLVSAESAPTRPLDDPLPHVRSSVRALLTASPAFRELSPDKQRELATAMVRVCHAAASLLREEVESRRQVESSLPPAAASVAETQSIDLPPAQDPSPTLPFARGGSSYSLALSSQGSDSLRKGNDSPPYEGVRTACSPPCEGGVRGGSGEQSAPRPLALAQNAGSDFSGVAANKVAGTTQAILNAVSFPRFVTELINGVFKAMLDSSAQQMNSFVELLNNVAASTEGFADSNMGADRARQWLVEKYPGNFEIQRDDPDPDAASGDPPPDSTLQLKDGASMPSENAIRTDLGLSPADSVPSGDPEQTLVPLARARLAKMRQEMLASMVMLGIQRIVIDSGRISAAMHFHIDTRSAAQDDRGSTFSEQNTISGSGSFGYGPWGASASMSNTIGYVSTERSQTTEEMNTSLDLNSSVEINFRSDYLPLNRLASPGQVDRIKANTRNPDAEDQAAAQATTARAAQNAASDQQRRDALNNALKLPSQTPPAGTSQTPASKPAAPQPAPKPAAKTPQTAPAGTPQTGAAKTAQTGAAKTAQNGSAPAVSQPTVQPVAQPKAG